jgi:hypothetical protein
LAELLQNAELALTMYNHMGIKARAAGMCDTSSCLIYMTTSEYLDISKE